MPEYTAPSNDNVDFETRSYTAPDNDNVDFKTVLGQTFTRSVTSHVSQVTSTSNRTVLYDRTATSSVAQITSTPERVVLYDRPITSTVANVTSTSNSVSSLVRNPTSHVGTINSTSIALSSLVRDAISHVNTISSTSNRVASYDRPATSHINSITSTSIAISSLVRNTTSYVDTITSDSNRVADYVRPADSHVNQIRSTATTERTSLELIDFDVTFDEDRNAWLTPWVQMTKILGSEDEFGLKMYAAPQAADPAARIRVEYDSTGNETVDQISDPVFVEDDEQLELIEGVPLDEDGYYRLVIDDYGGYNDLVGLDYAFIH